MQLLTIFLVLNTLLAACRTGSDRTQALESASEDLLEQVMTAGKLVVATDPSYPPQSFLNEQGEMDGFDINVAQGVARRLEVELEFVTPEWSRVTGGNWMGEWDVSIGSMAATQTRYEFLWFTEPYYYTSASMAVHRDDTTITQPVDLAGKRVGVVTSSTYEAYLKGTLFLLGGQIMSDPPEGIKVKHYTTDVEAFQDLALGDGFRLDAVLSAQPTIQAVINRGVPLRVIEPPLFYEPLVFALDKSREPSDKMLARLDEVLTEMRADGTLTDLSLKWYGTDLTRP